MNYTHLRLRSLTILMSAQMCTQGNADTCRTRKKNGDFPRPSWHSFTMHKVVLTPNIEGEELTIDLIGDLAGILS
ncbi:hypothetical protein MACH17_09470 [Phaeobacter inhibens]|nr:hypothetical protein MACH17_09470 [Phaeobacter inhibens]